MNFGKFCTSVSARSLQIVLKRNAGHSKWANIKHGKALKDAEKSKFYSKIGQYIRVAVQEGGSPNPDHNFKLTQAIAQGRRMSMPMGTIESIIKSTQKDTARLKPHLFEIRGPGSSVILCETVTPNIVQTKYAIASLIKKHKSKFSDTSLQHMFEHKGIIDTEIPNLGGNKSEDEILEIATNHAIEAEAEEVVLVNENVKFLRFICDHTNYWKVHKYLETMNYMVSNANLQYIPNKLVSLNENDFNTYQALSEKLMSIDDVLKVHDNIDQ